MWLIYICTTLSPYRTANGSFYLELSTILWPYRPSLLTLSIIGPYGLGQITRSRRHHLWLWSRRYHLWLWFQVYTDKGRNTGIPINARIPLISVEIIFI